MKAFAPRAVLAGTAAALLLVGCATPMNGPQAPATEPIGGRLSVRVEATPTSQARAVTAAFELRGDARNGALDLSTPLGTMLAQARWSAQDVRLVASNSERRYDTLDDLTRDVLGESLPVAALFDWLRGRPWSGAPSTPHAAPAPVGFDQAGWQIDLTQFDAGAITAHRAAPPSVTVRARLDR